MKEARKSMPSIKAIAEAQASCLDETRMGADQSEWESLCWRCGDDNRKRLERCHIIAKSLGGGYEPENFLILCKDCHKDMPDIKDRDLVIGWLYSTSLSLSGSLPVAVQFKAMHLFYDKYGGIPDLSELDVEITAADFVMFHRENVTLHAGKESKKTKELKYFMYFESLSQRYGIKKGRFEDLVGDVGMFLLHDYDKFHS